MSTPTSFPNASLARAHFRVSQCEMSGITRAGRFEPFCYVLYCTILLGGILFTFGLPQPGRLVGGSQPEDHEQGFREPQKSVNASLPASVRDSFRLDRLAAIELFYADGVPDPHQHRHAAAAGLSASVQTCGGRCLDPHPGPFRYWNGQQNGCWIQVWRSWPEGCRHFQWYNGCNGYWDSYPNGAPKVHWDCCVH